MDTCLPFLVQCCELAFSCHLSIRRDSDLSLLLDPSPTPRRSSSFPLNAKSTCFCSFSGMKLVLRRHGCIPWISFCLVPVVNIFLIFCLWVLYPLKIWLIWKQVFSNPSDSAFWFLPRHCGRAAVVDHHHHSLACVKASFWASQNFPFVKGP